MEGRKDYLQKKGGQDIPSNRKNLFVLKAGKCSDFCAKVKILCTNVRGDFERFSRSLFSQRRESEPVSSGAKTEKRSVRGRETL